MRSPPRRDIAIQNPSRDPQGSARRWRPWLTALVTELAPDADSFTLRLTGDRGIRRLNRTYRGKDAATDVLSFPGEGALDGSRLIHLGDVVVSVPAARRQSAEAGHSIERELRILILHGVLHCLGHDHETDGGAMERLERKLRRRWIGDV